MRLALGAFRGVCVDSADPRKLGRIRVMVPQVLGTGVSGWAFPAWSMHDLSIWPEDRLPQPGQGVWLMFEHEDRLVWLAAFGAPLLSDQRYDEITDDQGRSVAYETFLMWSLPVMPVDIAVPITGTLMSPSGVPQPEAEVRVEKWWSDSTVGWEEIGTVPVDPETGAWSLDYARPSGEDDWWYRVVFDGSDPFWPAEVEPERQVIPLQDSVIDWNGTADLVWRRSKKVTGTLLDSDGKGIGERTVGLYGREYGASSWLLLAQSRSSKGFGEWSVEWFWPQNFLGRYEVRALFLGNRDHNFSTTPTEIIGPPMLEVVVRWDDLPEQPVLNASYSTAGSVTVPDWEDLAPEPPEVLLERRSPAGSANPWTVYKTVPLTVGGSFATSYAFDNPNADHRARFPAAPGFAEGVSVPMERIIELDTSVSLPQIPTPWVGQQISVQSTVRDETGSLVPSGQAHLEVLGPSDQDFSVISSVEVSNGIAAPLWLPTEPGGYRLRISYDGTIALRPSVSQESGVNVLVGSVLLTKGTVGNTTAAFSWAAVPGAQDYEVQRGTTTQYTGPALSYTATGLVNDTDYEFRVRAIASGTPGPWSATITCRTGRPEIRNKGTLDKSVLPTASGTYRPSDGDWDHNGNYVVHGYFDTSSRSGHGVVNYDSVAFRAWVKTNYSEAILNNLVWESFDLRISREGAAGSNGKTIVLYVTSAVPRVSGQPNKAGGLTLNTAGIVPTGVWDLNETVEVNIPKKWAHWAKHILMSETVVGGIAPNPVRGFLIRQDSSANYAKYYGTNLANSFRLTSHCSWDYQTQSAKSGKWY